MNDFDKFKELHDKKQEQIKKLSEALKKDIAPKIAETQNTDGSKNKVIKNYNPWGKEIYTVSKDEKDVMTFGTKKQLMDYLDK